LVSPSRSTRTRNIPTKPILKSGFPSTKPVGKKLVFVEPLSYSACKCYDRPVADKNTRVLLPPKLVYDGELVIPFGSATRICHDSQLASPSTAFVSISDVVLPNKDINSVDFESMVDTMVQQIYSCGCCLSFKHDTSSCTNDIRCKGCFHYVHIQKNCLNSMGGKQSGCLKPIGFSLIPNRQTLPLPFRLPCPLSEPSPTP
jgi:hypothetical protein